jgi:hypothetical protein
MRPVPAERRRAPPVPLLPRPPHSSPSPLAPTLTTLIIWLSLWCCRSLDNDVEHLLSRSYLEDSEMDHDVGEQDMVPSKSRSEHFYICTTCVQRVFNSVNRVKFVISSGVLVHHPCYGNREYRDYECVCNMLLTWNRLYCGISCIANPVL